MQRSRELGDACSRRGTSRVERGVEEKKEEEHQQGEEGKTRRLPWIQRNFDDKGAEAENNCGNGEEWRMLKRGGPSLPTKQGGKTSRVRRRAWMEKKTSRRCRSSNRAQAMQASANEETIVGGREEEKNNEKLRRAACGRGKEKTRRPPRRAEWTTEEGRNEKGDLRKGSSDKN